MSSKPQSEHMPEIVASALAQTIEIRGAQTHNLENLDLDLPKNELIVFTGPSGSGKSSLAFDTIYAEGRRRYVESLSTYARQFVSQIERPEVRRLSGLSPTLSIEQKTASRNPRSTVGTITEIYDHLRVLFARLGKQFCHECGRPVTPMSKESIIGRLLSMESGQKFMLLAPLVENRKGEYRDLFDDLRQQGFTRVRIDGSIELLEDITKLDLNTRHSIEVVVDRLVVKQGQQKRIAESTELALSVGEGECIAVTPDDGQEQLFSTKRACSHCGEAFSELTHQRFSFNSKLGQCKKCQGLGTTPQVDMDTLVIHGDRTIRQGAIEAVGPAPDSEQGQNFKYAEHVDTAWNHLESLSQSEQIDLDTPWSELSYAEKRKLVEGTSSSPGLAKFITRKHESADSKAVRDFFGEFIVPAQCPRCEGGRLRPENEAVLFEGKSIVELCRTDLRKTRAFLEDIQLEGRRRRIGRPLLAEIVERLEFLERVGLEYLCLHRAASTLSGGEAQRIRLASQLGSELAGVLYVLDEPSIGLHARDQRKLLGILQQLRDSGNTVIVVEHDPDTMEHADQLVDFGPKAGADGGRIVGQAPPQAFIEGGSQRFSDSETALYLSGEQKIPVPQSRRTDSDDSVTIYGARHNNLDGIDVSFPLGAFICVTGVSGAGKSSLVNDTLWPALARKLYSKHRRVGKHERIEGLELIDKAIRIDQKPIGRTPRSNPATYTKVFGHIRELFADLPASRMYGFDKGRFSFNVKQGRCEACKGRGAKKVEMQFLADAYTQCEQCRGRRYDPTTLRIKYRGYSIADVLDMTVAEAAKVFDKHPKIKRRLQTLIDVGLDYIKLGQPSPTLSGGEAQRVKLSRELAKIQTGDTLYILDEPSIGLHFTDVEKLLDVIDRLVADGNTVVVIEHNMDILKSADHLIDLGPEGGPHGGGQLVATGTPEQVAEASESHTGRFLAEVL